MAYRRYSSRSRYTRGRTTRTRSSRSSYSGRTRRKSTRRVSSRKPQEVRIVIEQTGASPVSRYPGVAKKIDPPAKKAKY